MARILVTGSSTGIGRACVVRLARAGHTVLAGVRRQEDGEKLRAEAPTAEPIILDVTNEDHVRAAGEIASAEGLHGVVNNAGVARGGPLEYLPLQEWRDQLEINVLGQVAVTQAVLPAIRQGRGRIVFIGSIAGRVGPPMMGPYAASKHALEGISESLRQELHPWGIKVICVEPGAIKTEIWEKGRETADRLEQSLPAEAVERYRPAMEDVRRSIQQSEKRGVDADVVAKVVETALFTARPRARYLVGPDAMAIGSLSRVLPDTVKDFLVRRFA